MVSKWCPSAKKYDLLSLLWNRSGAPVLRSTLCCRCFGLEVVPQCYVRFVAVVLVSKWCPSTEKSDLLPLLGSRSGAQVLRISKWCTTTSTTTTWLVVLGLGLGFVVGSGLRSLSGARSWCFVCVCEVVVIVVVGSGLGMLPV